MKRLVLGLALILVPPAYAADPSEMLKDPVLEKQAEALGKELRCLVCQNESIEDSNADLARDLRIIVRERMAKGESPEQVKQYVVDRYGDYVLLNPPFKGTTLVLWLGPFALLLLGVAAAFAFFRRRGASGGPVPAAPLSAEEKRRLETLLKDKDQ
ncbi:cytochrome c-type biogenesis protein [Magnetospirillum sulfuroxidans]|uniref:Cytochrome c-type biogenesis protein n=1 Tax=Magnetospirillum sulfuroxidans TaxID=611300 RepID=A0ABS5IFY8_9PROT|nr:cytochrome c-type biogenesis protein [Magnetospirillum sulfuroxidans]MBR9972633.1 cytochrome c-type biogenesis protein CcmH [Magnetospirillum sulfuroxidans]